MTRRKFSREFTIEAVRLVTERGVAVAPCAETVPMLLWALLASGQIRMREVDGWETLAQPLEPMPLDLAA